MARLILCLDEAPNPNYYIPENETLSDGMLINSLSFEPTAEIQIMDKVAICNGNFQLYKSLHSKSEAPILLIHTIPHNISIEQFLEDEKAYNASIKYIRIIHRRNFVFAEDADDDSQDILLREYITSIIIHFNDGLSLSNFAKNELTKYDGNWFGSLHYIALSEVIVTSKSEVQETLESNCKEFRNVDILPGCISCLEKIDSTYTGLEILGKSDILNDDEGNRWPVVKERCHICNLKRLPENHCRKCSSKEENWICMICGYIGCGRYVEADALAHYEDKKHSLALDLNERTIWSYDLDIFAHSIIDGSRVISLQENQADADTINLEIEQSDRILMNASVTICEQLDLQRKYYESKIEMLKEEGKTYIEQHSNNNLKKKFQERDRLHQEIAELKVKSKDWKKERALLLKKADKAQEKRKELFQAIQNIKDHIKFLNSNHTTIESISEQIDKEEKFQKSLKLKHESLLQNFN